MGGDLVLICGRQYAAHDKVFDGTICYSDPPVFTWYCRRCYARGYDPDMKAGVIDRDEFYRLMERRREKEIR